MDKLYRFSDLVKIGLFRNRTSLKNAMDRNQFPEGRLIGGNSRVWTESELQTFLDNCPSARKVSPKQRAKAASADTMEAAQ